MSNCDRLLGGAAVLIFPSEWYEGLPRTIIESYAKGTPVISGKIGSLIDAVVPGDTGLHFKAGDPEDLAHQVQWIIEHPAQLRAMRQQARLHFETNYTPAVNYGELLRIYERAISLSERPGGATKIENAIAN